MFDIKKEDWYNGLGAFIPAEELRLAPGVWKDFKRFCSSFSTLLLFVIIRIIGYILFPVAYITGVFASRYVRRFTHQQELSAIERVVKNLNSIQQRASSK